MLLIFGNSLLHGQEKFEATEGDNEETMSLNN